MVLKYYEPEYKVVEIEPQWGAWFKSYSSEPYSSDFEKQREEMRQKIKVLCYEWGNPESENVAVYISGLTLNGYVGYKFLRHRAEQGDRAIAINMPGRFDAVFHSRPENNQDEYSFEHPGNYNFENYSYIAYETLKALGLKKVDYVGKSMGGIIGMMLASNPAYKSIIQSLTIDDIGRVIPAEALQKIYQYIPKMMFDRKIGAESEVISRLTPFGIADHPDIMKDLNEHLIMPYKRKNYNGFSLAYHKRIGEGFLAQYCDNPENIKDVYIRAWDYISEDIPVLILRGNDSDLFPKNVANSMLGLIEGEQRFEKRRKDSGSTVAWGTRSNTSMVEYDKIGHAPSLIRPQEIADVSNFIELQRFREKTKGGREILDKFKANTIDDILRMRLSGEIMGKRISEVIAANSKEIQL